MRKLVVLSHDLRVLCCDKGRLYAYPLTHYESSMSLAFLCSEGKGSNFCTLQPDEQWLDLQTMSFIRPVPRGWLELKERRQDQGILRLRICDISGAKENYLTVHESGEIGVSEEALRKRNGAFRCITLEEFEALRDFIKNEWVCDSRSDPISVNLAYSNIWEIHIGDYVLDINLLWNNIIKSNINCGNHDVIVNDKTGILRLVKFNPAILYIILKADQLPRFAQAVSVLHDIGNFKRTIFIASSLKPEYILAFIPVSLQSYIKIIPVYISDYEDYSLTIIDALTSIDINAYYPIISLDEMLFVTGPLDTYFVEAALNPLPTISAEKSRHDSNIFMRQEGYDQGNPIIFSERKIRGSLAFLQNKTFLQRAFSAYKSYIEGKGNTSDRKISAYFIEYIAYKYSLFCPSQQQKGFFKRDIESLFVDSSAWSLDDCKKYVVSLKAS